MLKRNLTRTVDGNGNETLFTYDQLGNVLTETDAYGNTFSYREARGFVLLSAMESLSLSALEAAACECPLFLSDLPWARSSCTTSRARPTWCLPASQPSAAYGSGARP